MSAHHSQAVKTYIKKQGPYYLTNTTCALMVAPKGYRGEVAQPLVVVVADIKHAQRRSPEVLSFSSSFGAAKCHHLVIAHHVVIP